MHLITYMSRIAPGRDAEAVLQDIVRVAQTENPKNQITGVLFFLENQFLQVIEGAEQDLRRLMKNIEVDPRHTDVDYLIDTQVESRGFQDWNMDSFDLSEGKVFAPSEMAALTQSFQQSLLPRSDTLVFFYKALLART